MYISKDGVLEQLTVLLLYAYTSHFDKRVMAVTEPMEKLHWLPMDQDTTPKGQPLHVLINKVIKGYFCDLFEEWSLRTCPIN